MEVLKTPKNQSPNRLFNQNLTPTRPKTNENLKKVHLIIKNTPTSTKVVTPEKYNLQKTGPSPSKKNPNSKKWTFEEKRSSVSRDKLATTPSKMTVLPSTSKDISRSNSKISVTSKTGEKKKNGSAKKIIENKKTSLSHSDQTLSQKKGTREDSSHSRKQSSDKQRDKVVRSGSNKKLSPAQSKDNSLQKISPNKVSKPEEKVSLLKLNPGVDEENTQPNQIDALNKGPRTLSPVKPPNIATGITSPEPISSQFEDLLRIKVLELDHITHCDKPALLEPLMSIANLSKPHHDPDFDAKNSTTIKKQETPASDSKSVKDLIIPGDEEDFQFEEDSADVNAIDNHEEPPFDLEKNEEDNKNVIHQSVHIEVTKITTNAGGETTVQTIEKTMEVKDESPPAIPEDEDFQFEEEDEDVNNIVAQLEGAENDAKPTGEEIDEEPVDVNEAPQEDDPNLVAESTDKQQDTEPEKIKDVDMEVGDDDLNLNAEDDENFFSDGEDTDPNA